MPTRNENWRRVCEHHSVSEPLGAENETPDRFAAVSSQRDEGFATTHDKLDDAFWHLGDGVLDGWAPYGVYDLDDGVLIEVHISTPVVTASEDQGVMVNALEPA